MTGLSFEEGVGSDVSFEQCACAYSSFHRTHLKVFSLSGCDLTEADLSGMELEQGTLHDTRFINASFFRTSLAGLDFTECMLEGVVLSDSSEEVRGAKMNLHQAAALAKRLGILLEE